MKDVLSGSPCASAPLNLFRFEIIKKRKGFVWAKHFHANVTIFEKDNQSCLFCFTAFTLSAVQVFIMEQNGVWNIILERGRRGAKKPESSTGGLPELLSASWNITGFAAWWLLCAIGRHLQSRAVIFREETCWNLDVFLCLFFKKNNLLGLYIKKKKVRWLSYYSTLIWDDIFALSADPELLLRQCFSNGCGTSCGAEPKIL